MSPTKWFGIVSLFPNMFSAITEHGVTGQAAKKGLIDIEFWNPRDFAEDRHKTVDDRPYGGGPGMLLKCKPLYQAIRAAKAKGGKQTKVIYLSPQGRLLNQAGVRELASINRLVLVSGRYEGIDERIIQSEIDEQWSIGDYVLTGGELPAMTMIDAVARFVPGVLGDQCSAKEDSFFDGLLDCPHYTRPEVCLGMSVPSVLLSGNHKKITQWRLKEALGRTWQHRPELLSNRQCSSEEKKLLAEFIHEYQSMNALIE